MRYTDDSENGLYGTLKRLKRGSVAVKYLKAFDQDDVEIERINMTDKREAIALAVSACKGLQWQAVRCYDGKDGVVMVHRRSLADEDPASAVEDIGAGLGRDTGITAQLAMIMGKAIATGQQLIASELRQTMAPMMDTLVRMTNAANDREELRAQQYEAAMRLNHRLSTDLARTHAQLVGLHTYNEQMARAPQRDDDEDEGGDEATQLLRALAPGFAEAILDKGKKDDDDSDQQEADERQEDADAKAERKAERDERAERKAKRDAPPAKPAPAPPAAKSKHPMRDKFRARNKAPAAAQQ